MASKRKVWAFASIAVLLMAATACGDDDEGDAANSTTAATEPAVSSAPVTDAPAPVESSAPATDGESSVPATDGAPTKTGEIQLGGLFAESGNFAAYGVPSLDGVKMAIEDINADGGVVVGDTAYQLSLTSRDTRSDPATATAAATELIRDEGIKILFGPTVGVTAGPVAQLTMDEGIMHFSPASVLEGELTPETVEGRAHLLFHNLIDEVTIGNYMGDALETNHPDATKISTLWPDDGNAAFILPIVEEVLSGRGYELNTVLYDPATTDFAPYLTEIKGSEPDVLFLAYIAPHAQAILEQSVELDAAPAFFAWNVSPTIADVGGGIEEPLTILYNTRQPYDPTTEPAIAFFEKYAARGELPQQAGQAVWYYDYVYMLAQAMEDAGSVDDLDAIAEALEKVAWDGVLGSITFNEVHTAIHGVDLVTVKDGTVTAVALG